MLQGTGSDVGKSLLVAGLCRLFARQGLAVRPFKPQNMSNNAAVTADGGEIGRAQALQARACGVAPSSHMNPVLLKPQTEVGAQVVVQGRVLGNATAGDYRSLRSTLMPAVLDSFRRLRAEADVVVVEGAGSPAEVNLRAGDIANMGFAEAADLPVILVADIDRGGVIASLVGTHALLSPSERERVRGYVINKFRGDPSLFDSATTVINRHTGWPSLGLVPWFEAARRLPAEDGVVLERGRVGERGGIDGKIRIVVPRLARIANFDDFDPLAAEPGVSFSFIPPGRPLPGDADVVILPGSKATLADLAFLRQQGWDIDLAAHLRRGGKVVGICAGYQMLGREVRDPDGIEGVPGGAPGLGLLEVSTVMTGAKVLRQVRGRELQEGREVSGYEMHMGRTEGPDRMRPWLRLNGEEGEVEDGAVSADGRVMGCYVHGLFASDEFRRYFLDGLRPGREAGSCLAYEAMVDSVLDQLADHLAGHMNIDALPGILSAPDVT
ncbi:MAG: cobyric acid synthase [Alphaproteobacteria bacterium]